MSGSAPARIPFVVGVNHRTGGLTLRDRLFVEDAATPPFLTSACAGGAAGAIVISTCDRVEIVGVSERPADAVTAVSGALAAHGEMTATDLAPALFSLHGEAAVRHLFRVASSLESVVIGEPQVLGQLKACHRIAVEAGHVPADLETLMQTAYACAKRVRTETAIGERPVSIAAAAIGLAREIHGDLAAVRALLVGTGDMGELIVQELVKAGLGGLSLVDPVPARAGAASARLGAAAMPMDRLAEVLAGADIVVAALGGRGHHLSADMVRGALKARRYRPQFLIDAALPRDIDPAVDRLDDAFLYDVQDLERLAMEGMASRENEAAKADAIVDADVAAYLRGRGARAATPALVALRRHVEGLRAEALREAGGDAEKATHLLVSRLLHAPSERLRELAADGEDVAWLERTLRDLFRLTDADGEDKP